MDVPLPLTSISQNHLEGSLAEVSVDELLDKCRSSLLTGLIKVHALGDVAVIEMRAGGIERSRFLGLEGDAALERLRGLGEGMYEVVQRLPDLGGALGGAAEL